MYIVLLYLGSETQLFLVPSGTNIVAILGIWSLQMFKDQQLYVIYKYVISSNVGFVANITY